MKRLRSVLIAILIAAFVATPVSAHPRLDVGIESYTYNIVVAGLGGSFMAVPAPLPYRYVRSIYASDLGLGSLMHVNEITYHDGRFFMTNGPTIVVLDYEFNLIEEITGVTVDGNFQSFTALDGIFVTRDGEVYVAEPIAERIVHLDSEFNLVRVLGRPEGIPLSDDFAYRPSKVAVDQNGRIYVIAANVYEGLVELNPDGSFNRYFGVINIRYTWADLFWRQLRFAAQRARMALWLPTSFTNLTVDPDGFVFATSADGDTDVALKKLNARGENIMRMPTDDHHVGELVFEPFIFGAPVGPSIMSQVHVTDFGVIYLLDRNRNRVFAYDSDGHLLFAFGGSGNREGLTQIVSGMAVSEATLVIADRGNQSLEVFELTPYGHNVLTAARHQHNADWQTAAVYWRQVLDLNPHFQYAHLGLGRWYYRMGYYHQAVHHFQRAQNVEYFDRAYTRVRGAFLNRNFNVIIIGIGVFIVAVIVIKSTKSIRHKNRRELGGATT